MTIDLKNVAVVSLRGVNLSFPSGTLTLLVGKTGAGKSTLLRSISGLERPTLGDIAIDGTPLWNGHRVQMEAIQNLTMVFQSPEQQLFATSVKKEFEYSLRPCKLAEGVAKHRIERALRTVGLPPTMLDLAPKSLSGGQQRRVAIATALATEPAWLLLDEPTAGLDAPAADALSHDIRDMADRGRGVIVATHDLDVWLPLADRLIIMQNGQVAADLEAAYAVENPGILADSGVGLPASAECTAYLRQHGWDIPAAALSPQEAAQDILRCLERTPARVPQRTTSAEQAVSGKRGKWIGHMQSTSDHVQYGDHIHSSAGHMQSAEGGAKLDFRQYIQKLDARAKWLAYVLLSVVILAVPVAGILPSIVVIGLLAAACKVPLMRFWHIGRPFLLFMAFTVIFSGLTWPIGYSVTNGLHTLLSLVRILLILMLGVLFTELTSTLEMKRGLEVALNWLKPLRIPVEAIAFGASLVLRFIPILGAEAKKFAEVSQIRAKRVGRTGQVRLRDASTLLMPLLFSLFQLGEDLSFAMEARGLVRFGMPRTSGVAIRWDRKDTHFTLAALVLSTFLVIVSIGLPELRF